MTNRAKAIASLSGVFLIGALCGALILGLVVRGRIRDVQRLRDRHGFEAFFVDRLKLTEAQRDSLQKELERTYDDLDALRRASAQQYGEVLDSFAHRVYPKLDSTQRTILRDEEQRLRQFLPRDVRRFLGAPREPMMPPPGMRPETSFGGPPAGPENAAPRAGGGPQAVRTQPGNGIVPTDSAALRPKSQAMQPASPRNGDGPLLQRLRERLSLDDEQTTTVRDVLKQTRIKMRQDLQDYDGMPRLQVWAVRRDIHDLDRGITSVLRSDQMDDFMALRQELRDSIHARIERWGFLPPHR